ncbi:PilW family protein [Endothiovibrio diazotrophicus]
MVRRVDTGGLNPRTFGFDVQNEINTNGPSYAEINGWAKRHLRTDAFAVDDTGSYHAVNPVAGLVYMQLLPSGAFTVRTATQDVEMATFTNLMVTTPASVDPSTQTWTQVDNNTSPGSSDPGESRRVIINIYFIAPCSQGSGVNDICVDGDDDIPTLKRLFLTRSTSIAEGADPLPTFELERLAEGVEYMKVEYGLDTVPPGPTPHSLTGFIGDGVPDRYLPNASSAALPTLTQWQDVVAARLYLLVRSAAQIVDHTDSTTFTLGTYSADNDTVVPRADQDGDPSNDHYKRQLFTSEVRLNNVAGRRERPAGTE